jgi:outer membrane receptor for ferrienterochelin and colicin
MKKTLTTLMLFFLCAVLDIAYGQGTTTSGINGKVTDDKGESLVGASVLAVESATGSQYGTVTDSKGFYRLPNINPGGPYKLTITYMGFEGFTLENLYLTLGQTQNIDATLSEKATQLKDVEIVANRNNVFDGNRTGAETVISTQTIDQMPTLNRSLPDYVRTTPQIMLTGGGMSIVGSNNRYNSIFIDGAVNNDVFGLSSSGTNGGQTGATAFSMDIIDQFQVQLAPYDVRQDGFNGASINAITKRGKNQFEGTAYYFLQNQGLAGKTPWESVKNLSDPEAARTKLNSFQNNLFGLSFGGPIIKDKLFFFVNAELMRYSIDQPYNIANYQGSSGPGALDMLRNSVLSRFGYDAGTYESKTQELTSDKIFARLDWNINKVHKLMVRHSYTKSVATTPYISSNQRLYFSNYGEYFPSTTNSSALELKSNWDKCSNNVILGMTFVRDNRNPLGDKFPTVVIKDGTGEIYFGSEAFSTANKLDQNIFSLTDNFSIYKGAHTITVGANFEFAHAYNLFIRQNYGQYTYNSMDDFMSVFTSNPVSAYQFDHSYSLVDDKTGDGSNAAAKFNSINMGVYAQDEWWAADNFKLTFGLRVNMPVWPTKPREATNFNDSVVPKLEARYDPVSGSNYDLQGARSGEMPRIQFMFDPRVGFNWDVLKNKSLQIRGGVGMFTSRLPLVWPGGVYINNGMTVGGVTYRHVDSTSKNIIFNPDWSSQPTYSYFYGGSDPVPQGEINIFTGNFKYPQVARANIGVDKKLFWGIVGTVEFIYTKNMNNIIYYNYNVAPATGQLKGGPDDRWVYGSSTNIKNYSYIMVAENTNKGYSWNLTVQLTKPFSKGFQGSVAYSYGEAKSLNDALSSQNSSQWRYVANVNGRNHLELSRSNFDMGHRVMAFVGYKKEYARHFATGLSLFYDGVSGKPYSFVYSNSRAINGEDGNDYALIWIPKDRSEINLVDWKDKNGNVIKTADQQWADLDSYINGNSYLKNNRGGYAARNGARLPFESYLDLRVLQDFFLNVGKSRHTLQVTLDIFNFLNLLNKEWGVHRYVTNDSYKLVNVEKMTDYVPTFTYRGTTSQDQVSTVSDPASRWRMQIGIRYIFGSSNNN